MVNACDAAPAFVHIQGNPDSRPQKYSYGLCRIAHHIACTVSTTQITKVKRNVLSAFALQDLSTALEVPTLLKALPPHVQVQLRGPIGQSPLPWFNVSKTILSPAHISRGRLVCALPVMSFVRSSSRAVPAISQPPDAPKTYSSSHDYNKDDICTTRLNTPSPNPGYSHAQKYPTTHSVPPFPKEITVIQHGLVGVIPVHALPLEGVPSNGEPGRPRSRAAGRPPSVGAAGGGGGVGGGTGSAAPLAVLDRYTW